MSGKTLADDHGAFMPGPRIVRAPAAPGVLSGLSFAVKDLIDVAGAPTTGGNPDWAATHAPAARDADVVRALLGAGAALAGKTVTDELAFSLEGANAFYGTPRHPRAPDRLPGGSSSGSAVAVAAGLVDFALGTDTGGSVRVPASFCGLHGFRPTHGRISLAGVLPFAPSYDTIGWFARSGALLERVGRVLLGAPAVDDGRPPPSVHLAVVRDAFDLVDPACGTRLMACAAGLGAVDVVDAFAGPVEDWLSAYQVLQGAEIWQSLGPWILAHRPRFGPDMAPRFESVAHLDPRDVARWQAWRERQAARLRRMLAQPREDGALRLWVLPTTLGVALPLSVTGAALGAFYARALALNALAGHAGLPQVTLPVAELGGLPLGLSLIGPPGSDETLLAIARTLS